MITIAIVTRNATIGGVETMIAIHQHHLRCQVFVVGGLYHPELCPFPFTYIPTNDVERLHGALEGFDVILYHWIPEWAQDVLRTLKKPMIEVVHRIDTAENDKQIPTLIIAHSPFLAEYIQERYDSEVEIIPHGIDVSLFPSHPTGEYIGGLTSYYEIKGVDIFLDAWKKISEDFLNAHARFYGMGADHPKFQRTIVDHSIPRVELLGAVTDAPARLSEFRLLVYPSRIEGLPFAILEGLACNIPIICSELPGAIQINEHAEEMGFPAPLILCRPEDPNDLAEKIRSVLSGDISKPFSRPYIEQFYNIPLHIERYWDAIVAAQRLHHRKGS